MSDTFNADRICTDVRIHLQQVNKNNYCNTYAELEVYYTGNEAVQLAVPCFPIKGDGICT
jgi:hypothetical protein